MAKSTRGRLSEHEDSSDDRSGDGPVRVLRRLLEDLASNGEPCAVRLKPQGERLWRTEYFLPRAGRHLVADLLDLLDEHIETNANGHRALEALILRELEDAEGPLSISEIAARLRRPVRSGIGHAVQILVERTDIVEDAGRFGVAADEDTAESEEQPTEEAAARPIRRRRGRDGLTALERSIVTVLTREGPLAPKAIAARGCGGHEGARSGGFHVALRRLVEMGRLVEADGLYRIAETETAG